MIYFTSYDGECVKVMRNMEIEVCALLNFSAFKIALFFQPCGEFLGREGFALQAFSLVLPTWRSVIFINE